MGDQPGRPDRPGLGAEAQQRGGGVRQRAAACDSARRRATARGGVRQRAAACDSEAAACGSDAAACGTFSSGMVAWCQPSASGPVRVRGPVIDATR
ncbi:hypothetical protein [Actinoplanes philippinensis]|uniref:hypothetical protein n=1 Tax=Actinoplanes philippinensis TaxID=35752 RepID=UPI000B80CD8A|nr:hypothetical protein [Actinoplanes philippinensis]